VLPCGTMGHSSCIIRVSLNHVTRCNNSTCTSWCNYVRALCCSHKWRWTSAMVHACVSRCTRWKDSKVKRCARTDPWFKEFKLEWRASIRDLVFVECTSTNVRFESICSMLVVSMTQLSSRSAFRTHLVYARSIC
jgi:hypothetical protein